MRHLYLFGTPYLFFIYLGSSFFFFFEKMSDVGRDYNDAWWSCSGWAPPRPKSIGTFHLINGGAAAAAHTHTHTRLFASYISRITCPLRIKKKMNRNYFFPCHENRNSIDPRNYFCFSRDYIWFEKKGGCHGDGMSQSIPDDVFNISRRSKCQKSERESMIDEKDRLGF